MTRRILVPLDGSDFGERVLPWALAVARPADELHLLSVAYTADPAYFFDAHEDKLVASTRDYLDEAVERIGPRTGPIRAVARSGRPGPTITGYAAAIDADLIAMTSHGRGPVSRFWMGSAADYVVRESQVPVLIVRPDEVDTSDAALPASMVVLLDGSEAAERALHAPVLLGAPPTTRLVLMQVVTTPFLLAPPAQLGAAPLSQDAAALRQRREAATEYLESVRARLAARGFSAVEVDVMVGASPATVAVERAAELGCPLIALTTHGRGGIARLFMGSVADKVIRTGGPFILVFGRDD